MHGSRKSEERDRDGERASSFPVPTRIIATDEHPSLPQTDKQRLVGDRIKDLADLCCGRLGMDRRSFLRTACGMAAAFLAMNSVYGRLFSVDPAEAADPDIARERSAALSKQFIFDVQTHFVRKAYVWEGMLRLRRAAKKWNPALRDEEVTLEKIKYDTFVKEVFLESDTTLALLSSAPDDEPEKWFLANDEIARTRRTFNERAGSKRLYSHAVFTPGQPGWLDMVDRAIEEFKPDSWKGYTVGAPSTFSKYPWRLDDEKIVYPAYDKMVKAGIVNVCIHKGLIAPGISKNPDSRWRYGKVGDVGKAAKDWPQLNFIIYHSGLRTIGEPARKDVRIFEKRGYIPWVTDLAGIPEKYGVTNVYGEIGTTFALSAISNPRYCAGILGTLIKGLGHDNVLWGTDSVWYGSPQWQIEAFRRIEIPRDLRKKMGVEPLGPADGPVKRAIFGLNSARLYGLSPEGLSSVLQDNLKDLKVKEAR